MKRLLAFLIAMIMVMSLLSFASAEGKYTTETIADGWIRVVNEGGAVLGYDPNSGVTLIEDDGFAFKDLNKNGTLDAYEDWRLSYEDRAADLRAQRNVVTECDKDQHPGRIGEKADQRLVYTVYRRPAQPDIKIQQPERDADHHCQECRR